MLTADLDAATAGAITEFIVPIAYSVVGSIATGPDGAMWFTTIDTIGRMTTAGVFTLHIFPTLAGHDSPFFTSITAGPDGALWSVEANNGGPPTFEPKIARITTAGVSTEFLLPTDKKPGVITAGSDGALSFTQSGNGICCAFAIGRMTTLGVMSQFPTGTLGSAADRGVHPVDHAVAAVGKRLGAFRSTSVSLTAIGG